MALSPQGITRSEHPPASSLGTGHTHCERVADIDGKRFGDFYFIPLAFARTSSDASRLQRRSPEEPPRWQAAAGTGTGWLQHRRDAAFKAAAAFEDHPDSQRTEGAV